MLQFVEKTDCTRIVRILRLSVELLCPQDGLLPIFFFVGERSTACGSDRDAGKLRRRIFPLFLLPKCRKALRIFFLKGGKRMKSRKKWRPGGGQRQSAAHHRRAVCERRRVVRLHVWKKGEKECDVAGV